MRNWLLTGAIALLTVSSVVADLPVSSSAVAETIDVRKAEADRLFQQATQEFPQHQVGRILAPRYHYGEDNPEEALAKKQKAAAILQKSLKIYQELNDRKSEAWTRLWIAGLRVDEVDPLEQRNQVLAIAKDIKDTDLEAQALMAIGSTYRLLRDNAHPQAMRYIQDAIGLAELSNNHLRQIEGLIRLSDFYQGNALKQPEQAMKIRQQAVTLAIDLADKSPESVRWIIQKSDDLNDVFFWYCVQSSDAANIKIHFCQKDLELAEKIKDETREAYALNSLLHILKINNNNTNTEKYASRLLNIAQKQSDLNWEIDALSYLADLYESQLKYVQAIEMLQRQLKVAEKLRIEKSQPYWDESAIYLKLSGVYSNLGDASKSNEYQEKYEKFITPESKSSDNPEAGPTGIEKKKTALSSSRLQNNKLRELEALQDLGDTLSVRDPNQALPYYEAYLQLAQSVPGHEVPLSMINGIANTYRQAEKYTQSIQSYQMVLALIEQRKKAPSNILDSLAQQAALCGLGKNYSKLNSNDLALKYLHQCLSLNLSDKPDGRFSSLILTDIVSVYIAQKDYASAIQHQQMQVSIEVKFDQNSWGQYNALDRLAWLYYEAGQPTKSLDAYQQKLQISQSKDDRNTQARTLIQIANHLIQQKEPDLAIVFYKHYVNLIQVARQDLSKLPIEQQKAYTATIAEQYRTFADLLLSQGRIGEAQQVLELLKVQELNTITEGTRSPSALTQLDLTQVEQAIVKKHDSLIAFGQKRNACKQNQCPQLEEYEQSYRSLTEEYTKFIEDVKTQLVKERDKSIATATDDFIGGSRKIVDKQPNTVLIYPLVLKDKTRILWASKGGVLGQTECPLGEAQLSKLIEQFRNDLQTVSDLNPVQTTGKQLYQCLLPDKLRTELTQNKITNLVFVPDRITNYIPMAALYDGQNYLIEKYSVSNILSVALTDTKDKLPDRPSVLGFGVSQSATLTNPTRNFGSLPYVPDELDNIVKMNPETDRRGILPGNAWLDRDFTRKTLETQLLKQKPNILHIATHGEFLPTAPKDSYLLLGDATPYEISKIQFLEDLENVHLVVLSACETALGGSDRNGLEVAGIASYFLSSNAKAKAVLASLWKVNDPATSLLMSEFYSALNSGKLSKAQALQQVQRNLIASKLTLQDAANRAGARRYAPNKSRPQSLSHPYYWAPFILIGNSL